MQSFSFFTLLFLSPLCLGANNNEIVEYHSLQAPFIAEWWQGGLPNWDFGASTVVTDKYVRLAPDKQSRVGWLWNTQASHLDTWEVTLTFRIHSKRNPGADGMALWYVDQPFHYDPTNEHHASQAKLWGNRVDFMGLGIIFDTYDNDGQRDNPTVTVVRGTGSPNQRWETDNDLMSQADLKCPYEYRNTNKDEKVKARIVYTGNRLSVFMSIGDGKETSCGNVNNVVLPAGYHFGMTATTGHLADNHDIYGLVVKAAPEQVAHEDEIMYGGGGHAEGEEAAAPPPRPGGAAQQRMNPPRGGPGKKFGGGRNANIPRGRK